MLLPYLNFLWLSTLCFVTLNLWPFNLKDTRSISAKFNLFLQSFSSDLWAFNWMALTDDFNLWPFSCASPLLVWSLKIEDSTANHSLVKMHFLLWALSIMWFYDIELLTSNWSASCTCHVHTFPQFWAVSIFSFSIWDRPGLIWCIA